MLQHERRKYYAKQIRCQGWGRWKEPLVSRMGGVDVAGAGADPQGFQGCAVGGFLFYVK